jgi:hypothetical protein
MATTERLKDPPPAPPDMPQPPAGEPDTAATNAEQRHHRISEAAYYRAQRRGFAPGADQEDWLEAEKEIDRGAIIPKQPEENDFPTPK